MTDHVEILFVEDDPADAELTIRALKKHNLTNYLIHIEDGAEALEFIFAEGKYASRKMENKPRLILLDLKMPKVDGLEVLHRIKTDPRTKTIPVVIMTSSKEEQDMIRSYQYGVNSYVVKPVEFSAFTKAVADLGLYWLIVNQNPK